LHQDSAIALDESTVKAFVKQHLNSLGLCLAYANTRKHVTRTYPGALIAQITSIKTGPNGQTATIGYRPWDQPTLPTTKVDALELAEQCEREWRACSPSTEYRYRPDPNLRLATGGRRARFGCPKGRPSAA
jgi:hypothetical protein